MRNAIETENGIAYNFGIRKPVLNCKELLQHPIWERVIGKWIYMINAIDGKKIFVKHVFHHQRVMQIIYSGKDICGDGVYTFYKVNLHIAPNGSDFMIEPTEYATEYGSFDFKSFDEYLSKVIEDGYITEEEKEILLDRSKCEQFSKTLYHMPDHF